ncbi:MAG: hypothetical protein DRP78_02795 [Candidatus Omnitrophota bacterium]|nr:MAG: hypothetical protein DRP78_02795 [Candidatus Omnitrophota bacterium]
MNYLKNIYNYRHLILTLAGKEIKIKYKSALLGWLWSILQPLLLMLIFSVIFTWIIKMQGIKNFPIFLLSALLPWFFFNMSLSSAVSSIIDNANLIKNVCFPYEIIPISVVMANFFNFLISLGLLLIFIILSKIYPTIYFIFLPAVVVFEFIFVLGICLAVSSLQTMFRDVKYIVELLLIAWFYASPVFYPLSFVPQKFRFLFYFNPLALFIRIYRDILLYQKPPDWQIFILAGFSSLVYFIAGILIFNKYKRSFADVV